MKTRSLLNALRFCHLCRSNHHPVPSKRTRGAVESSAAAAEHQWLLRSWCPQCPRGQGRMGAKGSGIQMQIIKRGTSFAPVHLRGDQVWPQSIIFALYFSVSSLAPRLTDAPQEFSMPSVMGLKLSPREMFEFQALVCGQVVGRPGLQWCAGCDTKSLQAM